MLTILKLLLSAGMIYAVNEIVIARSRPFLGSLIASLPLVSLITFVWIYYGMKEMPGSAAQMYQRRKVTSAYLRIGPM